MSDYSEVWEDMHEDQIKLDHKAHQCKEALIDNLNSDDMIRIMFTSYLNTVSNNDIIKLHDNFIAADETLTDVDTDGYMKERKNKMKRYGIYRINFTVDTGYIFKKRVCIIMATDSEEAMKDFRSWFNKVAPTESIIVDTLTDITFVMSVFMTDDNTDSDMIIYQDYKNI